MTSVHYTRDLEALFLKAPKLKERILYTLQFFPEVESIKFGKASKNAYYDPNTGSVRLTKNCSYYVIGHEITHHLQYFNKGNEFPKGERQCDIFLFARSPALVIDLWNTRDGSYLCRAIKVDLLRERFTKLEGQQMIYETCAEALQRRKEGHGHYMDWAEKRINERIEKKVTARVPPQIVQIEVPKKERNIGQSILSIFLK